MIRSSYSTKICRKDVKALSAAAFLTGFLCPFASLRGKTFSSRRFTIVSTVLLSICLIMGAQAQTSTKTDEPTRGSITGKVVNESGQPLAGAYVLLRVINSQTGRSVTTDSEGNFAVSGLDAGLYTLFANAPAYTPLVSDYPAYYRVGDSVRLELIRGGVITGSVINGAG